MALECWFCGKDMVIDIFSALVLLFLLINIVRYLKINRDNPRYKLLVGSFALLFLSFLAKIASHFEIYYTKVITHQMGDITFVHQQIQSSGMLVFAGLLAYRMLSLLALYLLYRVYAEKQCAATTLLSVYLILLVGLLSNAHYYIYYLTSLLILGVCIFSILKKYVANRFWKTLWLVISLGMIALSQGIFLFIGFSPVFYITAEIIQLFGYFLLLITFIQVLRDGKKKGKNPDN